MYRYELKPEKEDRTANSGKPWPLGTIKSAPTSNHNLLRLGYRRVKFVPLCIVHGSFLAAKYLWHRPYGQQILRDLLFGSL